MGNVKLLKLYEEEREYEGIAYQELSNPDEETDGIRVRFSVGNLSECPEDAIIGRDLFDASDYLHALKVGIKLAKAGYDDVDFAEDKE